MCFMDLLNSNKQLETKPYLNLFNVKRTRGWYPFVRQEKSGITKLAVRSSSSSLVLFVSIFVNAKLFHFRVKWT